MALIRKSMRLFRRNCSGAMFLSRAQQGPPLRRRGFDGNEQAVLEGATSTRLRLSYLSRPRLLRVCPGVLRQRHRAFCRLHGLGVRGGAVANAAGDALGDAGETEQVVG